MKSAAPVAIFASILISAVVIAACDDHDTGNMRAPKTPASAPSSASQPNPAAASAESRGTTSPLTAAPGAASVEASNAASTTTNAASTATHAAPATAPALPKPPARTPKELIADGEKIFKRKKCASCHKTSGVFPSQGPNLAGVSGRLTEAQMRTWIDNPTKIKPDTKMPPWDGTPADFDAVIAFLRSL